jgi:hypothetical protein
MQTLEQHLKQLVEKRLIAPETMREKLGFSAG